MLQIDTGERRLLALQDCREDELINLDFTDMPSELLTTSNSAQFSIAPLEGTLPRHTDVLVSFVCFL